MPRKNSIKKYIQNSFYHIYNRGVEKRNIFGDEIDYKVMLSFLKEYLLPKNKDDLRELLNNPDIDSYQKDKILKSFSLKNYFSEISLLAYCLMPNHFHLLINQNHEKSIDNFMTSLLTRYSMYFNKKYHRVGPLFQGVYKAVIVTTNEQLIYLSGYIHSQALIIKPCLQGLTLEARKWKERYPSSFTDYLGLTNTTWINKKEILSSFNKIRSSNINSYETFVIGYTDSSLINKLLIEG